MRGFKITLATIGLMAALTCYTKVVWQSGFDDGADVSLCVGQSLINNGGKLDSNFPACQRAKSYESSPLWAIRRRDGGK